jgi:uncharacterized protein (TIGR02284 family)
MFETERASHDVNVLNGLIETTLDSVDGYRRAAQESSSSRFSNAFMERANEREQILSRLRERVRELGGEPEDEGSLLARAHRAFLSLRDRITGSDDNSVLAEVDHGESYLKGKWDSALGDEQLSSETRRLVRECYDSVRRGHEDWRRAHIASSATGASAGGAFEGAGGIAGSARSAT